MGDALADELGLPRPSSIDAALRGRARPPALTIDRLARASGTRERIAIVARKLVPPPTFMRHWSPAARRGRAGLLLSYVRAPHMGGEDCAERRARLEARPEKRSVGTA